MITLAIWKLYVHVCGGLYVQIRRPHINQSTSKQSLLNDALTKRERDERWHKHAISYAPNTSTILFEQIIDNEFLVDMDLQWFAQQLSSLVQ